MFGFGFGGWGMDGVGSSCPNCGDPKWENSKDFECGKCGYKKGNARELPAACLVFCEGCAAHYIDKCAQHGTEVQKKVKL
jgi:hypothetical protein